MSIRSDSFAQFWFVGILSHPFAEVPQVATNNWIVTAGGAPAHYIFLLGGDRGLPIASNSEFGTRYKERKRLQPCVLLLGQKPKMEMRACSFTERKYTRRAPVTALTAGTSRLMIEPNSTLSAEVSRPSVCQGMKDSRLRSLESLATPSSILVLAPKVSLRKK